MRIIQQPVTKDFGFNHALCNMEIPVGNYVISISADNGLRSQHGNTNELKKQMESEIYDCHRTNMALFVRSQKNNDQLDLTEMEKHCEQIMQNVLGKENYIDHPSAEELTKLLNHLLEFPSKTP